MNDQIIIRGLLLRCRIGVPDEERAAEQELPGSPDDRAAGGAFPDTDEIEGTVDYHELSFSVQKLASDGERKLIETLANVTSRRTSSIIFP